jgi:serine/threonine protein kinase
MLKIRPGRTVTNEIMILKKIRDGKCIHVPELVWVTEENEQLGIVPVGKPIDFRETAHVSRNIVHGLIDGLRYLHAQNIVLRDIQPLNLILNAQNKVVIIDYEYAVVHSTIMSVEYFGGFICWPK